MRSLALKNNAAHPAADASLDEGATTGLADRLPQSEGPTARFAERSACKGARRAGKKPKW
jgi:hypothetical protein